MSKDVHIVERFREHHHAIARMFASGMTGKAICRATGMSPRRLTLYWNDPAFQELIHGYSQKMADKFEEEIEDFAQINNRLMIRNARMREAHYDRADDSGELLPLNILIKDGAEMADRFGFGKNSKLEVRHDFASDLDRAIARSKVVIDATAIEAGEVPSLPNTLGEPQASPPLAFVQEQDALPAQDPPAPEHLSQKPLVKASFAAVLGKRRKVA